MVIRNRLAALIYRIIAFTGLVTVFQFYWANFDSFWEAISCFDVEIGVLVMTILGLEVLFNLIDLRHGVHGMAAGSYMPISLPVTTFSTLSGILYFSYSIPSESAPVGTAAIIFHIILLVGPLFDWLFFSEKGSVRVSGAFTALIYPLWFFLFGYFRTVIWPNAPIHNGYMYAYPFLDFSGPYIVGYSILYFGVALLSVLFTIFLNNLLAGKFRRL